MMNQDARAVSVSNVARNATAKRIDSPIIVDGELVAFLTYNVAGSTYVGIRDLAFTLSGSPKQFNVAWDGAQNAILLTSGSPYNATGTEMSGIGAQEAPAIRVTSRVFLNGNLVNIAIYQIGGANFYRLRDVGMVLDFSVYWESARNAVIIDTSRGYQGQDGVQGQGAGPGTPDPGWANGREIDASRPMVALTFDDGPSQHTTTILNIMEQRSVVATFFFLGNRIAQNRPIVQRAFDMGCEIGNHTWAHPDLTRHTESRIRTEIIDTNNAIEAVTGVVPTIFRPPYGAVNATVRSVSGGLGLPIISWSVDPRDWESRNADRVFNSIMGVVRDRDIILCHDIYSATAEAMSRVIPALTDRGHQLVTVSELMRHSGITLLPGVVYRSGR